MRFPVLMLALILAPLTLRAAEKEEIGIDLKAFTALSAEIAKSKTLVVYKGFPRRDELPDDAPEPKNEPSVLIHGYKFRQHPFLINENEMLKLRELCAQKTSFSQWNGPKKCGGYHPDYCLQFKNGDTVTEVLLCFGCHEAKIFGKDSNLYCNTENKKLDEMGILLRQVTAGAKE